VKEEMMDFSLSPEQKLMCQAVREFMVGECKPEVSLELAKKKQFPWEIYKKAGQDGYLTSYYPKELGGQGLPLLDHWFISIQRIFSKGENNGIQDHRINQGRGDRFHLPEQT